MGWSVNQSHGLSHHQPARSVKGYTVIAPLFTSTVYLLDMAGRVVHQWQAPAMRIHHARLLPSGRMAVQGADMALPPLPRDRLPETLPFEDRVRAIGGNHQLMQELDWDGTVAWEYRDRAMHHDFARLPNGHTLLPIFVELPEDLSRRVKGGRRKPRQKLPTLIGDDLVEIDEHGVEVRRLHTWELLDPRRDPICPLESYSEWTHLNSIDVNDRGDIVFSCRQNSRVGIIDAESGALTWKYGDPDTFHQHHATWVDGGRIQIFDNGMHSHGQPASRVLEVDPATDRVTWQYRGTPGLQFFSPFISSAQRLPGANVLICEGATGRVFEVTRRGEVVWEWLSPFYNPNPAGEALPWIYRAYRHLPDDPALRDRDLDPERFRSLNQLHNLA